MIFVFYSIYVGNCLTIFKKCKKKTDQVVENDEFQISYVKTKVTISKNTLVVSLSSSPIFIAKLGHESPNSFVTR